VTRTPKNPAARSAPATHRVSPLEGEPPSVAPVTEGGGKTSPPASAPRMEPNAALAGTPAPGHRTEPDATSLSPDRVPAQDPVTAGPDGTPASGPLAVTGLSGDEERAAQRADWKRAQSAHSAAQRRGRVRRAPKQTGPGMLRRLPPEPPQGAA
jgi:hypothetical protein